MSETMRHNLSCRECLAGTMHMRYITYFTWLGDELITVPNFPAWICDVCGRREYDERAINWLSTLLSPNAGSAMNSRKRRAPALEKKRRSTRPTKSE